jgi:cytochrome P450
VQGEAHKRQRTMLNAVFRTKHLEAMLPVFIDSTNELVHAWNDLFVDSSRQKIMLDKFMTELTMDIIGRAGKAY